MKTKIIVRIFSLSIIILSIIYFTDFILNHTGRRVDLPHDDIWSFFCIYFGMSVEVPRNYILLYWILLFISGIGCFLIKKWGYRLFIIYVYTTFFMPFYYLIIRLTLGTVTIEKHFLRAIIPDTLFCLTGLLLMKRKSVKGLFGIKSAEAILRDNNISIDVNSLIGALKNESLEIRMIAAQKLGELGDKKAVDALLDELKPKEHTEREKDLKPDEYILPWMAISGIKALGQYRAYENPRSIYRKIILESLGRLKDNTISNKLYHLLKDTNEVVRVAAINTLNNLSDKKSIPYVIECLDDTSYGVRIVTLSTLNNLTGEQLALKTLTDREKENAKTIWCRWWEENKNKILH